MVVKFTLLAATFDENTWEACRANFNKNLQKYAQGHVVEISAGLWILEIQPSYPAIQEMIEQLRRNKVPLFLLPLHEPPVCCVTKEQAEDLKKLGVDFCNTRTDG